MSDHHWDYRAVRWVEDGEESIAIHEVYYTDDVPDSVTVLPVRVYGTNVGEVLAQLERMLACLAKPVLDYDELGKPSPAGEPPGVGAP